MVICSFYSDIYNKCIIWNFIHIKKERRNPFNLISDFVTLVTKAYISINVADFHGVNSLM